MTQYDNTNRGALFRNDKQGNDKRPDYKGKVNVAGIEYRMSGWVRKTEDGKFKLMSLQIELPVADASSAPAAPPLPAPPMRPSTWPSERQLPVAPPSDLDDDIPF